MNCVHAEETILSQRLTNGYSQFATQILDTRSLPVSRSSKTMYTFNSNKSYSPDDPLVIQLRNKHAPLERQIRSGMITELDPLPFAIDAQRLEEFNLKILQPRVTRLQYLWSKQISVVNALNKQTESTIENLGLAQARNEIAQAGWVSQTRTYELSTQQNCMEILEGLYLHFYDEEVTIAIVRKGQNAGQGLQHSWEWHTTLELEKSRVMETQIQLDQAQKLLLEKELQIKKRENQVLMKEERLAKKEVELKKKEELEKKAEEKKHEWAFENYTGPPIM